MNDEFRVLLSSKPMKMHYVIFDGTTTWVGEKSDLSEDDEIIFISNDLDECNERCDTENEKI